MQHGDYEIPVLSELKKRCKKDDPRDATLKRCIGEKETFTSRRTGVRAKGKAASVVAVALFEETQLFVVLFTRAYTYIVTFIHVSSSLTRAAVDRMVFRH